LAILPRPGHSQPVAGCRLVEDSARDFERHHLPRCAVSVRRKRASGGGLGHSWHRLDGVKQHGRSNDIHLDRPRSLSPPDRCRGAYGMGAAAGADHSRL